MWISKNSSVMRALGYNYKEMSNYQVVKLIEKELDEWGTPLSSAQKSHLQQSWAGESGHLPFVAMEWVGRDNQKANILWRLSFPLLVVWCILLLAFIPIKWLLTGTGRYTPANPKKPSISKFTINWIDKVIINRG